MNNIEVCTNQESARVEESILHSTFLLLKLPHIGSNILMVQFIKKAHYLSQWWKAPACPLCWNCYGQYGLKQQ